MQQLTRRDLLKLGTAGSIAVRNARERIARERDRFPDFHEGYRPLEGVEGELRELDLDHPLSTLRAIALLAGIDRPVARELLQELRNGPPQSIVTQAAIAAERKREK